jgi:hypothetical protein
MQSITGAQVSPLRTQSPIIRVLEVLEQSLLSLSVRNFQWLCQVPELIEAIAILGNWDFAAPPQAEGILFENNILQFHYRLDTVLPTSAKRYVWRLKYRLLRYPYWEYVETIQLFFHTRRRSQRSCSALPAACFPPISEAQFPSEDCQHGLERLHSGHNGF